MTDNLGCISQSIADIFDKVNDIFDRVGCAFEEAYNRLDEYNFFNNVSKTHTRTKEFLLDGGFWLGRVGITSTTSSTSDTLDFFHTFSDIGNDGMALGGGINLGGWFGYDLEFNDELTWSSRLQLTPWFHIEKRLGWSGAGYSIGFDSDNKSLDFEAQVGAGTVGILAFPQLIPILIDYGQVVPAPMG